MFLDIHAHAYRIPGPNILGKKPFITPAELIGRYDAIGVRKAVLLPVVTPEFYLPQAVEDILEAAEQYPGRFIPFCNINPQALNNTLDADLSPYLDYYKSKGCLGFGEVMTNLPIAHPLIQNLFKHVEKSGLPLTFHIAHKIGGVYGIYDDPGLPQLEESLQRFPELRFLGHSQTFWAEMGDLETVADRAGYPTHPIHKEGAVPKLMRRYKNLLGDLSAGSGCNALSRDEGRAVEFIHEFQDRLYFGTDITSIDTPTPLVDFLGKLLTQKKISREIYEKISWRNAATLFGIGEL